MGRVWYVMKNPGGHEDMNSAVIGAINDLINDVSVEANIDAEDILELSFVANPVMHHLLLGIDPVELGGAPFALATDEALTVNALKMGVVAHPLAKAYLLPCVAGHVGADTAGMVLSEQPQGLDEITLLVDVGTNAEERNG